MKKRNGIKDNFVRFCPGQLDRCGEHTLEWGGLEEGQFEGMEIKRFVLGLILRFVLDNSSRDVT